MIGRAQLLEIMPYAKDRVNLFLQPLNDAMKEYEIDNGLREAAFLAQIAHESGELHYVRELASGKAYEGRNGNTHPGDGPKYKGRGLLQLTGRSNYDACGTSLGLDLLANPELLEVPENACRSAGWFWQTNGLNELADQQDFARITERSMAARTDGMNG